MVGSTGGWTNTPKLLDSFDFIILPSAANTALLTQMYEEEGLSIAQIAQRLGISKTSTLALLKKANIRRDRLRGRDTENYRLRPPFGWHVVRGKLMQNRREMKAVKFAKKLQAQGISGRALTRKLNEAGLTNRAGKPFGNDTVVRMLRHPFNFKI